MNFPLYFSKKIALSKDNKNNLSKVIVFIGRLSVALGILVSVITLSTGLGSKYAIKNRLSDFGGMFSIKPVSNNSSYNSSILDHGTFDVNRLKSVEGVKDLQKFANVSGILRTKNNFAGIIFKGIGSDFDYNRFEKFLVSGTMPRITEKGYNNEVILSEKISNDLAKRVGDSVAAIFSKENRKPIYRKFKIAGIYKTDLNIIDDLYIIGDINHARKILGADKNAVGGYEVFLKKGVDAQSVIQPIEQVIGYKNYAENIANHYPQITDWVNIFDMNIALIITLMLVVVVINIIMVLLILIIERTNSIGILKTLGATNAQIRSIFINYTLIIMIPGLLIGNIVALGLLLAQRFFGIIRLNPENYYVSEVPVDLNPIYIIAISLGVLLVSALALILPSYLISKIPPMKSVKYN